MKLRYPHNHDRIMIVKPDDGTEDGWMVVAGGVLSRSNSFTENTQTVYYFSGRGAPETEPASQEVSVSFTGNRAIGDPLQDYIFDEILFDLGKRDVELIDYDDGIDVTGANPPPNGWRTKGSIVITDPGSGDTISRQSVGFTINFKGKPQRGTVVHDAAAGTYAWSPVTP